MKESKIIVKNIPYQTAYYTDSMLYTKSGFRIVAIYYDEETKKFERIEHEFLLPE